MSGGVKTKPMRIALLFLSLPITVILSLVASYFSYQFFGVKYYGSLDGGVPIFIDMAAAMNGGLMGLILWVVAVEVAMRKKMRMISSAALCVLCPPLVAFVTIGVWAYFWHTVPMRKAEAEQAYRSEIWREARTAPDALPRLIAKIRAGTADKSEKIVVRDLWENIPFGSEDSQFIFDYFAGDYSFARMIAGKDTATPQMLRAIRNIHCAKGHEFFGNELVKNKSTPDDVLMAIRENTPIYVSKIDLILETRRMKTNAVERAALFAKLETNGIAKLEKNVLQNLTGGMRLDTAETEILFQYRDKLRDEHHYHDHSYLSFLINLASQPQCPDYILLEIMTWGKKEQDHSGVNVYPKIAGAASKNIRLKKENLLSRVKEDEGEKSALFSSLVSADVTKHEAYALLDLVREMTLNETELEILFDNREYLKTFDPCNPYPYPKLYLDFLMDIASQPQTSDRVLSEISTWTNKENDYSYHIRMYPYIARIASDTLAAKKSQDAKSKEDTL